MAESDPKKLRPFAQSPARRDFESEDDPLVELARIVSEDSSYYGSKAPKPKPQPHEPIQRSASSADLESELLQELDRSFAPRSDAVAGPRPAPPAEPPAPPRIPMPRDDADDLLRSIEEQLGEFERRAHAMRAPDAAAPADEQLAGSRPGPIIDRLPSQPAPRADRAPGPNGAAQGARRQNAPGPTDEARIARPQAPEEAAAVPPPVGRPRVEGRFARNPPPRPDRNTGPDIRQSETVPVARREPAPEGASDQRQAVSEPAQRRPARSGFAAGAATGWRDIESDEESALPDPPAHRRAAKVELPREMRPTFGQGDDMHLSRQAAAGPASRPEPELTDRLEPNHADPSFGGRWQEADDPQPDHSDEPRMGAAFGSGVDMETPAFRKRRARRKGLVTAAALLAVVAVGGGVAAYMRASEEAGSGPPPLIAAPQGADKVAASQDAQQAEGENVGEAVYNRVAGTAPAEGDRVVEGAEEPEEISRIVPSPPEPDAAPPLPADAVPTPAPPAAEAGLREDADSPGAATPDTAGSPPAPAAAPPTTDPGDEPVSVGPRRVRTFVVRPDGTIAMVEEAAGGGGEATPPPATGERGAAEAAEAAPAEPVRVATTEISGADRPAIPAAPVPEAGFDAAAEEPAAEELTVEEPDTRPPAPAVTAALPPPEPAPEPAPEADNAADAQTSAPTPAPADETPILPDLDEGGPDTTAANPPPAATPAPGAVAAVPAGADAAEPATPPAADGFVVQISSQRSEAQARSAYAGLQRRFSSVLGGLQPNIQEADLGAKGVFFRVRVGPYATRAEAIEVCESLQAAGGSCFVTR